MDCACCMRKPCSADVEKVLLLKISGSVSFGFSLCFLLLGTRLASPKQPPKKMHEIKNKINCKITDSLQQHTAHCNVHTPHTTRVWLRLSLQPAHTEKQQQPENSRLATDPKMHSQSFSSIRVSSHPIAPFSPFLLVSFNDEHKHPSSPRKSLRSRMSRRQTTAYQVARHHC